MPVRAGKLYHISTDSDGKDCSCRGAVMHAACTGRTAYAAREGRGDAQGLQNEAAFNAAFPEAALQPH